MRLPRLGDIWQSVKIFLFDTTGGGAAIGNQWEEARILASHPTTQDSSHNITWPFLSIKVELEPSLIHIHIHIYRQIFTLLYQLQVYNIVIQAWFDF